MEGIEFQSHKVSLSYCERCGREPAVLMVIGEKEGETVQICRPCRRRTRFPMVVHR